LYYIEGPESPALRQLNVRTLKFGEGIPLNAAYSYTNIQGAF
jgi:hypothetical protein